MRRTDWMLTALLASGGCGTSQMPPPELMRSLIQEVRAETEGHSAEASAGASFDEVRDATARHDAITDDLMDGMGMEMAGLDHCTGSGMDDLRVRHAEGLGELSRHRSAIDEAFDIDEARNEIARHGDAMRLVLDAMDTAVDAMGCEP